MPFLFLLCIKYFLYLIKELIRITSLLRPL
nr:MAG TPA: hypothetical protein [Caudoviricetes sp.]